MLWEQVDTSPCVRWCPWIPTALLRCSRSRCGNKGIHIRRGHAGFFLQMAQARWVGEVVLQGLHFGRGLEKVQALSFRLKEGIMKTFIWNKNSCSPGWSWTCDVAPQLVRNTWSSCLYLQSVRINHAHHHAHLKQYSRHGSDLLPKHKERCLARLLGDAL